MVGKTWKEINNGIEVRFIGFLIMHPTNSKILYAAAGNLAWGILHEGEAGAIYRTTDGGETWVPKNNGLMSLDVRSLAIDPTNPDVIYAGLGEGAGIYRSTDGGETWEAINYGIIVECPSYLQRVGQARPGISLIKPKSSRLVTTIRCPGL
jgi:hypothetical protein